jgi:hypothetical protein
MAGDRSGDCGPIYIVAAQKRWFCSWRALTGAGDAFWVPVLPSSRE